ncbi:CoA-binding protein [Labedella phragmitis]|uniref:CoA-binding protein n=1 Tax=Labedella phragmitis TaxID=2498849 RepID=A0A3S3ZPQ8_9MICO|nr:acetate--CoA ligase family protein [Labedella phragmitis]RWZ50825.1 CoA-binding protein [Labedella phragmitis]
MPPRDLVPLLAPRGVVVVGASGNPEKLGYAMASSLKTFPGDVRLVNSRPTAGMHSSIAEAAAAGGVPDLAIMCVPATHTASAVRESAEAGIGAALVCAGGFAEAGGVGVDYARDLDTVVAETGIRLLGPNTSGFFVPDAALFASFVPGVRRLGAGSVAVVAASGGINHVLSFRLESDGAGVSLGVGIGAGQDVSAPDVLQYLIDHEPTRAVILHVETVPDGRALMTAVAELAVVKPVVALVVGRNDVSEFARSHTGALATSWRTTRAALRQAGAVLVGDEAQAVAAATALSARRARASARPGVALITAQAGPGLLIADALGDANHLPALGRDTQGALADLLPPLTFQANPVDTGRPSETFPAVVRTVAADPVTDVLGVYAITEPVVDIVTDVLAADISDGIPVVIGVDGPASEVSDIRRSGRESGVPVLSGPNQLAHGLAALTDDARARAVRPEAAISSPVVPPWVASVADEGWDEARGKDLLDALGVPTPPRYRCADRDEARRAWRELDAPLAVKLLDASVLHKTEVGGVVLGVRTTDDLERALDVLEAAGASEFLVESMAGPGVDLVVGARNDDVFGPIVAVGVGGIATEVLGDVAIRTAPLAHTVAVAMTEDLVARELLLGHRGGAAVDLDVLADIVVRLGALVADGVVDEIEINPLRSTPSGIVALDAIVLPAHKEVRTS